MRNIDDELMDYEQEFRDEFDYETFFLSGVNGRSIPVKRRLDGYLEMPMELMDDE